MITAAGACMRRALSKEEPKEDENRAGRSANRDRATQVARPHAINNYYQYVHLCTGTADLQELDVTP